MKYGSNPNGIGASSESPVHVAVRDGFTSMIEVLLSNGASPDGRDSGLRLPQFGTIPLYTAIIYDRFEEFILLLRYGADPNLIMRQPGFSNSLIDGSIRHNADVKWIKVSYPVTEQATVINFIGIIYCRNEPLPRSTSTKEHH